jgi:hypothetical protein
VEAREALRALEVQLQKVEALRARVEARVRAVTRSWQGAVTSRALALLKMRQCGPSFAWLPVRP